MLIYGPDSCELTIGVAWHPLSLLYWCTQTTQTNSPIEDDVHNSYGLNCTHVATQGTQQHCNL